MYVTVTCSDKAKPHALQIRSDLLPEMKLRGLVRNNHIHVSLIDLYIPTIDPHILLQRNRRTNRGNIEIAHRYMNVEIGNETAQ